jgi:hypothetical protein
MLTSSSACFQRVGGATELRKLISSNVMSSSPSLKEGVDRANKLGSRGVTPLSRSIFTPLELDMFEGNNKQAWLDLKTGWCHMCQEPIGGSMGVHIGDRDHTNLQFFLNLYAAYPRPVEDGAERVLSSAEVFYPHVYRYATTCLSMDHLHVVDDAVRRAELEACLFRLSGPSHNALTHSLQGKGQFSFWYSGERIWKRNVTKMVAQMFPAMSAGMMTNFTQKCWGRTNGDRIYDAMNIQRIKRHYGWEPYENKEKKAFFMRQLFWEMENVEMRADVSETSKLLTDLAIRRMCFEMIFLQSMEYMNRVQRVHQLLGRPTWQELRQLQVM